jgi:Tfp pilus assembly protein PilF
LHAAGRGAAAEGLLAAARPTDPAGVAQIALAAAEIALAEDRLGQALALLLEPEAHEPRHAEYAEAWMLVGRALARAGDAVAAEPFLMRALELAPHAGEAPGAWYQLAQGALAAGEIELARERRARSEAETHWQERLQALRLRVQREPGAPKTRLALAGSWVEAREWERARVELDQVVRTAPARSPEHLEALLVLARLEQSVGSAERARRLHATYLSEGGSENLD